MPINMLKFVAIAVAASTFDCTPQVEATFSLVATDSQTRMVGGVGASCNASSDIFDGLYIAAPGKSVLVTQALLLERGSEIVHKAEELMRDETPPIDVLATMRKMDKASQKTKVGTFPTESLRQYGTIRSLSVARDRRTAVSTNQLHRHGFVPLKRRFHWRRTRAGL